jgi:hypothetical protein
MLMTILFNCLVGAVLGMRFKVQVLFLAAPLAFVITGGIVGVTLAALEPALLGGILAVVALQIGYIGGLCTRVTVAAARVSPKRSLPSTRAAQG